MSRQPEKRSFRYAERSKDDVKERANAKGGNFDSTVKPQYKRYKIKVGKNLIRILPPTWEKPRHYGYDIWVNYSIGVDNQSYLSLSKMKGEKDPLEEARREAAREGDEKMAKDLQPRQRILMWVIDRNDEDEGPQLFDMPFTLDKDVANLSIDEDTKEVMYIDDPDNGNDLRFYKEGEGLNTKYPASKMKLLAASPLSEDGKLMDEWLEYVSENPVPDCLNFYDYEHIAQSFNGQAGRRDDDEDDDKPRKRAIRDDDDDEPKPKRRAAPIDDDDDEPEEKPKAKRSRVKVEEDVEVDEEDDEPAPKARRGATGRAAKPADNDDDEDEPEEKPAKPAGSLRERLATRRSASSKVADDDDEDD